MIQVKISELKNRLSYYLRLVRGGEQVEILDRDTPLARIVHVSQTAAQSRETPWIKEVQQMGIVSFPQEKGFTSEFLTKDKSFPSVKKGRPAVLEALLEERKTGR